MANLRNIKDRISSIKNTQKITKAMKMVAAAKVRKAENAVKSSRPFAIELAKMFRWVNKKLKNEQLTPNLKSEAIENYSELLAKREVNSVGLVIVSSNKGLAGAYCANIVRYSLNMIKELKKQNKKVVVYLIGQKAIPAIKNAQKQLDFEIRKTYINILDGINSINANIVATNLAQDFIDKQIDEIRLVTTRYKNMMTYVVEDWKLLPVDEENKFHTKELDEELNINHKEHPIEPLSEFLPNLDSILKTILPMYVTNIIYQSLLEAQASELASRMTAMSSATNNADDMINLLTIEYNKARQAKITNELTEVISGASALKG